MNICKTSAGSVSASHIESRGFKIFKTMRGSDMGQGEWDIPQFTNEKIKIVGCYWTWFVKDMDDNELWQGWWNTNEEFDKTIEEINNLLT